MQFPRSSSTWLSKPRFDGSSDDERIWPLGAPGFEGLGAGAPPSSPPIKKRRAKPASPWRDEPGPNGWRRTLPPGLLVAFRAFAVVVLLLAAPSALSCLEAGVIEAVPVTGKWLPGGQVIVEVRANDPNRPDVAYVGCVDVGVSPGRPGPGGNGDTAYPSAGFTCPANGCCYVPEQVVVHLHRASSTLHVEGLGPERRLHIVVPWGTTQHGYATISHFDSHNTHDNEGNFSLSSYGKHTKTMHIASGAEALVFMVALTALAVGVRPRWTAWLLALAFVLGLIASEYAHVTLWWISLGFVLTAWIAYLPHETVAPAKTLAES